MVRKIGRLTALTVSKAKAEGMHADGGGLYLQVTPAGTKSWIFRFMLDGRAREMGLGSITDVSLTDARTRAGECRRLCHDGIDPIEARKAAREQARLEAAKAKTFKECADAYIEAHRAGWRNAKHVTQWTRTLETYAVPIFGSLPVQQVDLALVMRAVEPIWTTKTETASRLRGRIEAVLDWATVRGYRKGDNPARWRGHLEELLPRRGKVGRVTHHPALPYGEIGVFLSSLREQDGIAARALDFAILTATRTSEAIGARWDEVDLAERAWVIPAARVKAGKEHRVPLSAAAIAIIERMKAVRQGQYLFPGGKRKRPLSNMAMLKLLHRMGRHDLTVHGFRSTFRDWAAEMTNFPREVAEMALAHAVSDDVEAAYRRGDLFRKRRQLMDAWAKHCGTVKPQAKVVPMTRAGA